VELSKTTLKGLNVKLRRERSEIIAPRTLGTLAALATTKMKPIQLTLTLAETNIILEALGQMPFAKVYQVIDKIQQQANQQLQESQSETETQPQQDK
jgi:hypothetical protein